MASPTHLTSEMPHQHRKDFPTHPVTVGQQRPPADGKCEIGSTFRCCPRRRRLECASSPPLRLPCLLCSPSIVARLRGLLRRCRSRGLRLGSHCCLPCVAFRVGPAMRQRRGQYQRSVDPSLPVGWAFFWIAPGAALPKGHRRVPMGRSGSQHGRLFFLPAATFRCGGRCEQATSRQARSGATDKLVPLNLGMRLRSDYLVVTSHQHISVGITITAANHTRRSPMALSPLVSLRTHLQEQPPWSIASHEACTNNRCTSPSGQQMLSGTLDGKGPLALNGEKGRRGLGGGSEWGFRSQGEISLSAARRVQRERSTD